MKLWVKHLYRNAVFWVINAFTFVVVWFVVAVALSQLFLSLGILDAHLAHAYVTITTMSSENHW